MADIPRAYKLNKEKQKAAEDGEVSVLFLRPQKADVGCSSRRAVR